MKRILLNRSFKNELIAEEYAENCLQPVNIKIEQQLETNTENPQNHNTL